MDISKCEGCPVFGQYRPIEEPLGNPDGRFLVVTNQPSQSGAKVGRLIAPGAMAVLAQELENTGFNKDEFRFLPAIRCAFDPDKLQTKVKTAIKKACRAHLQDEIAEYPPEVIIPLGGEATTAVFGKGTKIMSVRGIASNPDTYTMPVFPLMDPAACTKYPQNLPLFSADIQSFARFVGLDYDTSAAASVVHGEYVMVDDLQFLIDMDPELIAFDTENTSLRWYQHGCDVRTYKPNLHRNNPDFRPRAQILTMQFCVEPGKAYVLRWDHPENPMDERRKPKLRNQLRKLLCDPKRIVIGQNTKYDALYLWKTEGIRFRIGGDTLMLATLLDENSQSRGLDTLVKIYKPEMAGYCVAPDTKIWMSDLTWKRAADVAVGQELVGFDEHSVDSQRRCIRKSTVLTKQILRLPCVKIRMTSGTEVTVSTNHSWLVNRGTGGGNLEWQRSDWLKPGTRIKRLTEVTESATSFDAGWFSGILDGEGWTTRRKHANSFRLGFAQKPGLVLDRALEIAGEDFALHNCVAGRNVHNVTCRGSYGSLLMLQKFRPIRLLSHGDWWGCALPQEYAFDTVESIEDVGVQEVVSFKTSTHTFVAEGLASHNSDYFDKTYDKSRMWEHPLDAIRGYGGGDADATLRVYEEVEARVAEDEKLWAHYVHVSLSGLNAFVGLEARGMFVDQNGQMARFKEHLTQVVEEQRKELLSLVPKEIKREHLNDPKMKGKTPEEILSFRRADFVLDILFFHEKGFKLKPRVFTATTEKLDPHLQVPSTSTKKHLPFFYDICPFTVKLTQYVQNKQLLDTSIIKFEENFVVDGMVRPTYSLTTAVTGRSASKDPNGQNFPKRSKLAAEYGKQFVAPPGWLMIAPDLSQAELRIAASMANEPTMIQIYRDGGDIHKVTAAVVMKVAYESFLALAGEVQKPARQKAKAVNFGFLFGMWWKRFISYAKTDYGVDFTDKDAKEVRENFFKRYKKLAVWHDNVKAFAQEHGYVRSYTGRIRHLPMIDSAEEGVQQEALRQAINSPVQETASSLGVMALGRMNEEIDTEYLRPVGFIHDSLIGYVRECHLDWGLKTFKHYMESAPMLEWFGTEIKVPIVADASFGKSFGEQIECPGFTLDKPYDFNGLVDKEGKPLLGYELPAQVIPPNNGRVIGSAYTDPDEQEAEFIMNRILRTRKAA